MNPLTTADSSISAASSHTLAQNDSLDMTAADIEASHTWPVEHNDHVDKIETRSVWSPCTAVELQTCSGFDWYEAWVFEEDRSLTNAELRQNAAVQACLQKLASLSRPDFVSKDSLYSQLEGQRIPLFEAQNGDEYQIGLTIHSCLPRISCPFSPGDDSAEPKHALYRLRDLVSESPTIQAPSTPKYVIQLGHLDVRTRSRYPECFDDTEPITERTDYDVMIDAESDDMPLWLFVSQAQLEDRLQPLIHPEPIFVLPIFQGLLVDGKSFYYDCACMLPSIRDLGATQPLDKMFDHACELIRKTRSIRYPGVIRQTSEQLEEFVSKIESLGADATET